MKKLQQAEILNIQSAAERIAQILESIEATAHPLEKQALTDELTESIRPGPGISLINLAHTIVDENVAEKIRDFVESTRTFYPDKNAAIRAAETTPLVFSLTHERNLLNETPSVASAQLLLRIFTEYLESPEAAAIGADDENNLGAETPEIGEAPDSATATA